MIQNRFKDEQAKPHMNFAKWEQKLIQEGHFFWPALLLSIAIHQMPFLSVIHFPLQLLGTYFHEWGHGIAAYLVGGRLEFLEILPNLGGTAYSYYPTDSASRAIVPLGGLIGTPLAGAVILLLTRRLALGRYVLAIVALSFLATALIWAGTPYTRMICFIGAGLGAALALQPIRAVHNLTAQIIAIQMMIETFTSLDYIWIDGFERQGAWLKSDIAKVADHLWGPRMFWSIAITCLALAIIAAAAWFSKPKPVTGQGA
ncbi:MAG: M50 family metallopeptidase [Pseudomonadota bacterium]